MRSYRTPEWKKNRREQLTRHYPANTMPNEKEREQEEQDERLSWISGEQRRLQEKTSQLWKDKRQRQREQNERLSRISGEQRRPQEEVEMIDGKDTLDEKDTLEDKEDEEKVLKKKIDKYFQYNCDQCQYKTWDKSNLNIHVKSIHEGKKEPCEQCPYSASPKGNIKKHVNNKH